MTQIIFDSSQVTWGQVKNVNVVTYTCTIWSWIIIPKDIKLRQFTDSYLGNIWHKVVWNTVWQFPNQTTFMSTDRIEITKICDRPWRIWCSYICKNLFHHQLSITVWVNRWRWHIFGHWRRIIGTVNCCTWTEDDVFNIIFLHFFKKGNGTTDVVLIIFQRFLNRFTHCLEGRKVNN